MKKKSGNWFMLAGLLLLAAAFVFAMLNIQEENKANANAQEKLSQLQSAMPSPVPETEEASAVLRIVDENGLEIAPDALSDDLRDPVHAARVKSLYITDAQGRKFFWPVHADGTPMAWADIQSGWQNLLGTLLIQSAEEPLYLTNPEIAMPVITLDGEKYIGILDIPSLELSLPIMKSWSYPKLKIAPCRYKGSVYSDNLIICGHNYDRHFGHLNELEKGDIIRFTDTEGHEFVYTVAYLDDIEKHDIDRMNAGSWDLTLFTCTKGGKTRVTVRCNLQ